MRFQSVVLVCWIFVQVCPAQARVLNRRVHGARDAVKVELTGFAANEEQTIERALTFLAMRLAEIESDIPLPLSRFERCVAKYATKDFVVWDPKRSNLENKYANAYAVYADLTRVVDYHVESGLPVGIAAMTEPLSIWGRSMLGNRPAPDDVPDFYIELNQVALRKYPQNIGSWAGTIVHEFLHRTGLTHPTGYPGSLISEAEGCFMRRFADKPLSSPH